MKWIAVAERTPEKNRTVIVAFDTHSGKVYTTARFAQDGRAHFPCDTWYVEVSGGQQLRTVTHWAEFDRVEPSAPVELSDEDVFEALRDDLHEADGGYVVDTGREFVVKAGRALLARAALERAK